MIRIKILTVLLILGLTLPAFSLPPNKEKDKIVLSYLDLNDPAVGFVAFDVHSMILRKKKGFLWPAVKLTFSKEKNELIFVVTAIDNSWCNMFNDDETPRGYFTLNGRLFIVSTKGETPTEFNEFFTLNAEIGEKTFYKADAKAKPIAKNPIWTYLHRGSEMATVLKSVNIENLGR